MFHLWFCLILLDVKINFYQGQNTHPFRFSMSLRSDQHRVLLVAYKRHPSCNPCHTDCNWPDASVYCWWGKFASQME